MIMWEATVVAPALLASTKGMSAAALGGGGMTGPAQRLQRPLIQTRGGGRR